MLTLALAVHDSVEIDGTRYRFVKELADDRALFVSDVSGRDCVMSESEIEAAFAEGRFRALKEFRTPTGRRSKSSDDEAIGPEGPSDADARARAFYAREWDKNPATLSTRALEAFIARTSKLPGAARFEWKPSAGTLRRIINERGEPGNRPINTMQSRRGKRKVYTKSGIVERVLRQAVGFYWGERTRTVTDAYAFFNSRLTLWNMRAPRRFPGWQPIRIPTYETLRAAIRKAECQESWASKYSKDEARRRFAGTVTGVTASRILERVIIDSTIDDVFLVDLEHRLPLGRPTLVFALDLHSRLPPAIIPTFEPMSLYSVMAALIECNTPKTGWRKEDLSLTRDFDCWGRPYEILVDNAFEQTGVSFQDACEDAGTSVVWAPIHNPEYKAVCERFIHTIQKKLAHKLKGAVPLPAHLMRKLHLKPSKDACVDIAEYRSLLRQVIVEDYQMAGHASLMHPPALTWIKSKEKHGRQFVPDLTLLRAASGRVSNALVTREGVRHGGHRFHDAAATSALLDDLASRTPVRQRRTGSATARVKIKLDPGSCALIHVWNDVRKRYIPLPNVNSLYTGSNPLSWAQHEMVRKYAGAENIAFQSDEERWAALNKLRAAIEMAAGSLKSRALLQARRVIEPPAPLTGEVQFGNVAPTTFGDTTLDLEIVPGASHRADGGMPEPGPKRGKSRRKKKNVYPRHHYGDAPGRGEIDDPGRVAASHQGSGNGPADARPVLVVGNTHGAKGATAEKQNSEDEDATPSTMPFAWPAASDDDWVNGGRRKYDA